MLGSMLIVYSLPVIMSVFSLLVTSSRPWRKVLYLAASIGVYVLLATLGNLLIEEEPGLWMFIFGPAVLITGIRLIISTILDLPTSKQVTS
ncbi:hypothetical protein [Streptosporangium sp. 'caverna']|uniref:hypothetical protein n=1 Tax=Streptosporangium sp. 'caverna' TaxID=2202249 RepID=UPI000D7D98C9|nr:hypothetical protein [Streptosporangium sp. 'caverna']AWS40353.1 hypothetical protein DKM19_02395 [Streptosporangium sp. 'caverna']